MQRAYYSGPRSWLHRFNPHSPLELNATRRRDRNRQPNPVSILIHPLG